MNKLKVVFIGGLTNGKIVYDYLVKNKFVDLQLVITYSENINKPRFVKFPSSDIIVKSNKANDNIQKIKKLSPDLIFVAGWSELLKEELLNIPSKGVIGFHPAKLPRDRGRSVLAWQIEEGYTESALSMFYYTDIPDGGDIIAQETFQIEYNDYINDVLDKVDKATYNIMKAYFPLLRKNIAPKIPQNTNLATFRRLRNENDSLINWNRNSVDIYNKIRAIASPYPNALIKSDGRKIKVIQSKILNIKKLDIFDYRSTPGTVMAKLINNNYIIKSRDGCLLVKTEDDIELGSVL